MKSAATSGWTTGSVVPTATLKFWIPLRFPSASRMTSMTKTLGFVNLRMKCGKRKSSWPEWSKDALMGT